MGRMVHFEFLSDDPQGALAFYEAAFGWKGEQWGDMPYWLITTGPEGTPGIDGAVGVPIEATAQRVITTMDVDDLDAMLEKVTAAGGTIVSPKSAVPMVGWMAYCADPTGVVFGMMQSDENARSSDEKEA